MINDIAGVGNSSFEELVRSTRQRQAAERAAAAAAAPGSQAATLTTAAGTTSAAGAQVSPAAGAAACEAAAQAVPSPLGAVDCSPAADAGGGCAAGGFDLAHGPDNGLPAGAAADSQGNLPTAQQQATAELDPLRTAAAGSPAVDADNPWQQPKPADGAEAAHPAAQPFLDEQSRSASRSGGGGGTGAAADALPVAVRMAGAWQQQQQQQQWPAQQEADGQHAEEGWQGDDAALGEASFGGHLPFGGDLPGGISCSQLPSQLPGRALSCGQQLQQHQPFIFEGAFSDDSLSCPLSPSV